MGVRIDEAGHDNPTISVNHLVTIVDQVQDFSAFAHAGYSIITNQHGAVFNDRKLTQLRADSRTSRPGKSYKL